jgi:hypothetical protein
MYVLGDSIGDQRNEDDNDQYEENINTNIDINIPTVVKNASVDDNFNDDYIYENNIKYIDQVQNDTGDYNIKMENIQEIKNVPENRGRDVYDDKMNKKYSKKKEIDPTLVPDFSTSRYIYMHIYIYV